MTVVIEGSRSFFVGSQAFLVEEGRDTASAWANEHIRSNPAFRWVLGKYVEADQPNSNKQLWSLEDLQATRSTINDSPMNMLHQSRRVVGHFVANELIYPVEGADDGVVNPYVEALGVFYKYYFPEELALIEAAHAEGSLYFSMECVAKSVTCTGDDGCGTDFPYLGARSDTYCAHLNEGGSVRKLNSPHFLAGALLIPPVQPGWKHASVYDLSGLMSTHIAACEATYAAVSQAMPHLSPKEWEALMAQIVGSAVKA